jgi:AcrR family transcriptional regulator
MPRVGLDPIKVTEAAASILDRDGPGSLSIAKVAAELGVKSPSLYNHVAGLDDLIRSVTLLGINQLAEMCRTATMGRAGSDALRGVAQAIRSYATEHPGVYPLTQIARPDDEEISAAGARAVEPAVAVLTSFGLEGDDLIHAARALRSAVHGFVMLDSTGGFGLDVDVDASFDWMVGLQIAASSSAA